MEITQLLKLNLHHNEKIAYQSPSILVATNKLNDDKNLLGKNIQVQEFALLLIYREEICGKFLFCAVLILFNP